ncbi:hypothetical protein DFH09DRAFT_1070279 [Mycena vulgaris]|nr:hypothetical protein DFH09DRAFT_1070279 [Mycena vulgaris]
MPSQPSVPQIRFTNILTALSAAVVPFEMVSRSLNAPFLETISKTMRSLLNVVQVIFLQQSLLAGLIQFLQSMKKNTDECTRMLEQIHELIYAIIHLHISSDLGGGLAPNMLDNLGKFTTTLQKIHTFVEAQQETSRIKKFFRQAEISTLLKGCNTGLEEALEVFKVNFLAAGRILRLKPSHNIDPGVPSLEQCDPHAATYTGNSSGSTGVDFISFR